MISADSPAHTRPARRPVGTLRWWICGMLFASTVINYLDRQTLSLLAPFLKLQYHWTNIDYANLVIVFRIAYTVGQPVFGRLLDRVGVRLGLTVTVIWYSLASALTAFAGGLGSFAACRFLLGLGESANWPAATKAVSEWFPSKERAIATAFFDSGSSLGGAVAPFLVFFVYARWGWRPAFLLPGLLGAIWLIFWRRLYYSPGEHPLLSQEESAYIAVGSSEAVVQVRPQASLLQLLRYPSAWAAIVSRLCTDPVWFFIADWFPIVLAAKGFALRRSLVAVWVPFIAADLGNLFAGWLSGWLVRRNWPVATARRALILTGGIGATALVPSVFSTSLPLITLLFGMTTFSLACFSTMANVLPADLFQGPSVASVSGLSGSAAGTGTICAFELVGRFSDQAASSPSQAFNTILLTAAFIPLAGAILASLLLRSATSRGRNAPQ